MCLLLYHCLTYLLHRDKIVVMAAGEEQEMIRLGRAFAALGAKPEYTPAQLEDWMLEQAAMDPRNVKQEKRDATDPNEKPDEDEKPEGGATDNPPDPLKNLQSLRSLVHANPPRLPNFSGDNIKGDVSYSVWKYEVDCLRRDPAQNSSLLLQSIRRSVRGTAADVLTYLGQSVTVDEILDKYDVVFGDVLDSEQIMEKFYSAHQDSKENIAVWGCRIEDILSKAKKVGAVTDRGAQRMMQEKFWSGLYNPNVKAALRHHHDAKMEYHQLFRCARSIEAEFESKTQSPKCQQIVTDQKSSDKSPDKLDQILAELLKVNKRVDELETKRSYPRSGPRRCYKCQSENHIIKDCPQNKKNSLNDGVPISGDKA